MSEFKAKLEPWLKDWDMLRAVLLETPFISDYHLEGDLKPVRGDITNVEGNVISAEFKRPSSFKE